MQTDLHVATVVVLQIHLHWYHEHLGMDILCETEYRGEHEPARMVRIFLPADAIDPSAAKERS